VTDREATRPERAPAKLNWSLEVVGRRADGFHLLESEMVSIDLCDEVHIEASASSSSVEFIGPFGPSVPRSRNTVLAALSTVSRTAAVRVDKHIPAGGGLGGGSSDAAAILRWAGMRDLSLAATVGSDVPFCVSGGRAIVRGVGDVVEPLPFVARDLTIFLAPFGVNTARCYAAFDEMAVTPRSPRNHLTAAARVVEPRLNVVMEWLSAAMGAPVELSGSGSTTFIEGFASGADDGAVFESPVGAVTARRVHTVAAA
jgi:4-diphosphocytidyl-2-C-methyl-D-erythritol kinase